MAEHRRLKLHEFLGNLGRAAAQTQVECIKHYVEVVLARDDLDVIVPLGDEEIHVDGIALLPNQIPQLESLEIETETDIAIGYEEDMELNPDGTPIERLGTPQQIRGIWIDEEKVMIGVQLTEAFSANSMVRIANTNHYDGLHSVSEVSHDLQSIYLATAPIGPESGLEGMTIAPVLGPPPALDMGMTQGLHQRSAHVRIKAKFTGSGALEAFEILRDRANADLRAS